MWLMTFCDMCELNLPNQQIDLHVKCIGCLDKAQLTTAIWREHRGTVMTAQADMAIFSAWE